MPPPSIHDRIRASRELAGYSQAELVKTLHEFGIELSRSHYANMEKGRHDFRPDHISALSVLLSLEDPGAPTAPIHDIEQWADSLIHRGHRSGTEPDADGASCRDTSPLRDIAGWIIYSDEDSAVDGAAALLERAACWAADHPGEVRRLAPIYLVGLPGDTPQAAGIPTRLRKAMLEAMRNGFRIRHIVQEDPQEPRGRLVRLIGSLIACHRYQALVSPEPTLGPETIVVPKGPEGSGLLGAGIQHLRSNPSSDPIEDRSSTIPAGYAAHLEHIALRCRPLVSSFSPGEELDSTDVSVGEFRFYGELTERREDGAWAAYSLGWFPNALVPPSVYVSRLRHRESLSDSDFAATWAEMATMHTKRFNALRDRLSGGHPVRVLILDQSLQSFVERGSHHYPTAEEVPEWRRFPAQERREVIKYQEYLLEKYPHYEVRVIRGQNAEAISKSKLEIRGGLGGHVVVQTPSHSTADPATSSVGFFLDAPIAVAGFNALFQRYWRESGTFDPQVVLRELDSA
jgi:DNA-binding XRE family transcriptional regulator